MLRARYGCAVITIVLVSLIRKSESFTTSASFLSKPSPVERFSGLAAVGGDRKRRRRRKKPTNLSDEDVTNTKNTAPVNSDTDYGNDGSFTGSTSDELPEFDLAGDEVGVLQATVANEEVVSSSFPQMDELMQNDPLVLEAMQGSSSPSFESARDLLRSRDRKLESTFEFDEVANPLPTAMSFMNKGEEGAAPIGKKRARNEARRAAAIEAAEKEKSESLELPEFFSNVPFLSKNKKEFDETEEKYKPIKLVEQGTWACIFILVSWEIYINSPFFSRAAPMAPVVY